MMFGGDSWLDCMQVGLSEADLGYFAPGRQNAPIPTRLKKAGKGIIPLYGKRIN